MARDSSTVIFRCLALQRGQAMDVWRSCEVLGLVTLTFLYSFVIGCLMSYALIKVVYAAPRQSSDEFKSSILIGYGLGYPYFSKVVSGVWIVEYLMEHVLGDHVPLDLCGIGLGQQWHEIPRTVIFRLWLS
ncbi:hypothetical protein DEO72_LG10g274 [Vigna unguiculata]|uniref:Uncharacterized protein n=1 Tax=Vigna unguiculata TaxID=3917 RepID=A0A4D6NA88_VIGUN|nr:hypothetical protein DEO72_LG10g274 [Vigna unguiculata]